MSDPGKRVRRFYFRCPVCESDERFSRPSEDSSSLGCLIFLFGGLLPAILFEGQRASRIQCEQCGYIFRQPPIPKSPVERLASSILAILVVLGGAAILLFQFPEVGEGLPAIPFIVWVEETVSGQDRVVAYLLISLFLIVPAICWTSAIVARVKVRRRLSDEFELRPAPSFSRRGSSTEESPVDAAPEDR